MKEGDTRMKVTITAAKEYVYRGRDGKLRWTHSHFVNKELVTEWPIRPGREGIGHDEVTYAVDRLIEIDARIPK